MKQPGAIGYVVINFDGKHQLESMANAFINGLFFRYPREGLPWGQNSSRAVRSSHRRLGDEDEIDLEQIESRRRRLRLPENAHEAGYWDDCNRLYCAQLRERIYSCMPPAVQVLQGRGWSCRSMRTKGFPKVILCLLWTRLIDDRYYKIGGTPSFANIYTVLSLLVYNKPVCRAQTTFLF